MFGKVHWMTHILFYTEILVHSHSPVFQWHWGASKCSMSQWFKLFWPGGIKVISMPLIASQVCEIVHNIMRCAPVFAWLNLKSASHSSKWILYSQVFMNTVVVYCAFIYWWAWFFFIVTLYLALHSLRADRTGSFWATHAIYSAFSIHSTDFFPKLLITDSEMCHLNIESEFYLWYW